MRPVEGTARDAFTRLVERSVREVFDAIEPALLEVRPSDVRGRVTRDVVSSLGFASTSALGALTVAVDSSLARALHPAGSTADLEALTDWSREVSNLVVGRLKLALLSCGIVVQLALPTTVVGGVLTIHTMAPAPIALSAHWGDLGTMVVIVDVVAARDVTFEVDEVAERPQEFMMF